jgi:hypothetical protein
VPLQSGGERQNRLEFIALDPLLHDSFKLDVKSVSDHARFDLDGRLRSNLAEQIDQKEERRMPGTSQCSIKTTSWIDGVTHAAPIGRSNHNAEGEDAASE